MDGVIEAGMSSATARNMSILQHIPFVVPFKDRVKVSFVRCQGVIPPVAFVEYCSCLLHNVYFHSRAELGSL